MLSLLIEGNVFTGDTLFKNSVGGVRAPGSTSYADLKHSVMDVLLTLPPETVIRPGHTDPTTVADELEHNRFVRIWRGLDEEGTEACTALGEPATLILLGDDYDGGHKAWVRWPDGRDDIVPGSKVEALVRGVLRRVEAPAVDQLDPVAVRVGDEGDQRQLAAVAGVVRGLLGLHADRGQVGERGVDVVDRDRHVVVARAEVVGLVWPRLTVSSSTSPSPGRPM